MYSFKEKHPGGFPSGPGIKNMPCNAVNMCSIPEQETKIPPCQGETKPEYSTTTEPACSRAQVPQWIPRMPQLGSEAGK